MDYLFYKYSQNVFHLKMLLKILLKWSRIRGFKDSSEIQRSKNKKSNLNSKIHIILEFCLVILHFDFCILHFAFKHLTPLPLESLAPF
ncbi:MAG: hypothetical protein A2149_07745 [Candidatus Schekmanbacteria bacterium RBG_16_38_11]|uniref:Uncharacterized protein n=1 Tax=Candidatus Schekmanbacteria bacterium RBG_16_38_11 TaxID=1817880 RepID=A0A1F7RT43_9BACT|nr:MAG: hypothetical protein A2149_07745 [Candidatus Schekmanbacteria bacterium RBG_16_38_11]